jgi:lipopolysaccharide export LptBFGC system permease protein LptF
MNQISPVRPEPAEARNDALAVCALLGGLFVFPFGLLFGHLSNYAARDAGRRTSPLAVTGLVLAYTEISLGLGLVLLLLWPFPAGLLIPGAIVLTVSWALRRQRRRTGR